MRAFISILTRVQPKGRITNGDYGEVSWNAIVMMFFIPPLFTCGKVILVRAWLEKSEGKKKRTGRQYVLVCEEKRVGKKSRSLPLTTKTQKPFFLSFVTAICSERKEVFECVFLVRRANERACARATANERILSHSLSFSSRKCSFVTFDFDALLSQQRARKASKRKKKKTSFPSFLSPTLALFLSLYVSPFSPSSPASGDGGGGV